MEGDTITLQEIFKFDTEGKTDTAGRFKGSFRASGILPVALARSGTTGLRYRRHGFIQNALSRCLEAAHENSAGFVCCRFCVYSLFCCVRGIAARQHHFEPPFAADNCRGFETEGNVKKPPQARSSTFPFFQKKTAHFKDHRGRTVSCRGRIKARGVFDDLGGFGYCRTVLFASFRQPPPVTIALVVLGSSLPVAFIQISKDGSLRQFDKQLPDALDVLCNCVKAGFSFQSAMDSIAHEMPDPIAREFKRVCRGKCHYGISLEESLNNLIARSQIATSL